ncbi:methyltransferase domain-containing protein [Corallococcus sp. M34]|uniref:SAM-dependent methyltransferase n=1 Tax=Citreicoccus inhibens TaxID=2849499 RepID=UPI001C22A3EB|nr:methyltransferase domain-containing protein [Citreicoccus inhibens]MBU8900846.1 methyltransferase domain-containing protein [Citreicoccus inhibens]
MSLAVHFPLYQPASAQRAFGTDEATRRFAKVAQLEPGSRVLVLGAGPDGQAALLLAQELNCTVVAADTDDGLLASVREQAQLRGVLERVELRKVSLSALDLPAASFNAILIPGRVPYALPDALGRLRPLLAKRGRLGLTYPARVGRHAPKAALDFWEHRLGAPLLVPRELMQTMEAAGFEPEAAETLHDAELDSLYQEMEAQLTVLPAEEAARPREEVALHREHNGRTGASYAFIVGRRKEPGEKPPASRDRG